MGMVHVRHVRVGVAQPFVAMRMRVRLAGRVGGPVPVLMMLVVHMRMGML